MEFKRNSVIAAYLMGKSVQEIVRELKHLGVKKDFAYGTIKRYIETGSTKKRHGGGRKKIVDNTKMVEMVKARFESNPKCRISEIVKELNISRYCINKILNKDVQLAPSIPVQVDLKEADHTGIFTEKQCLNATGAKGYGEEKPLIFKRTPEAVARSLQRKMKRIILAVINYKNEDGRALSEAFMSLPTRQYLPSYYAIIKRPMYILKILQNIEERTYGTIAEFEMDFFLLCQNAQTYNEETSPMYIDSIELRKVFISIRQRIVGSAGMASSSTASPDIQYGAKSDDESIVKTSAAVVKMELQLDKSSY